MAMSGGVDSSVAAWLLRQAGHDVVGVFMRHGEASPASCDEPRVAAQGALPIVTLAAPAAHKQGCCTASDALDARRVADRLEVPFYALNFAREFGAIMDYFSADYLAGRTPNPCVMCNNWLKFGKLFDYADSIGAQYVATGHYARVAPAPDGLPALYRGLDGDKDQSYVLFGLPRARLERVMLPVGGYTKPAIRQTARQLGLRVADKPDSQEICFVPDQDYAGFIRRRLSSTEDRRGEIVTTAGAVLGMHPGIENFTVGQRRGLGVAVGARRYVVRIEPHTRRVVVGERHELGRHALRASGANWLVSPHNEPRPCQVKIRYNGAAVSGTVRADGTEGLSVAFDEPRQGVAPGQAVVCYDDDRVLCGGWID